MLNSDLIQSAFKAHEKISDSGQDERLGILWSLVKPLLHELGHSNLPRDRFFEGIHQIWCDCVAMRNILFKDKRENGCLVPNKAGKTYINLFCKRLLQKGIKVSKDDIFSQPFLKMLNHLHRLVGEAMLNKHDKIKLLKFDDLVASAKVIIRGYLDDEYLKKRKNHRFSRPLTLNETIDVMVSMLLWIEKVHALGYAINDVKAGNIMMNCRGQIKGIDLDFYQKAPSLPQAFMQDFFLLSWACLLLFINAPRKDPMSSELLKQDFGSALQKGADSLRDALLQEWKFVDLSVNDAREFIAAFVDIIFRSRAIPTVRIRICFNRTLIDSSILSGFSLSARL